MTIDIVWTRSAEADLTGIIDYIAADSPQAALQILRTLQNRAQTLAAQSMRGRIVPELLAVDVRQYRELTERPWRIVYRTEASRVVVMAVLDSRRDLETLLLDRLIRD